MSATGKPGPESSKTKKRSVPDKEELQKSVAAAQKVVQAQGAAEALKQQAKKAINPKERMRLLQEAYHKEIEAHGQSKYAKRLQSGPWQGAAAGGGIGGGVAMVSRRSEYPKPVDHEARANVLCFSTRALALSSEP